MCLENGQLATDEPVEVRDFRRIKDQFGGIYRRIYLNWMKAEPEDVNM
jgi:hypothetical protein